MKKEILYSQLSLADEVKVNASGKSFTFALMRSLHDS